MEILKGEALAKQYEEWGNDDPAFLHAARVVRGEIEMSEEQKEFISLTDGMEQKEIAEIVDLDYRRVQVLLNRTITSYNFKPLNEKLK